MFFSCFPSIGSKVHRLEEKLFHSDCFYAIDKAATKDVDKKCAEVVEFLKKKVEVRERRHRIRSYESFLKSDALELLGAEKALFQRLVEENLIVCISEPDFFQFVPRVLHSGFVYVSTHVGGIGGYSRRWVVLRETSLIFNHENKKQLIFEIDLSHATGKENKRNRSKTNVFI
jgi:hypothetical protein